MNIRVDLNAPIKGGMEVVFRSPVDCSQITGLIVYYREDGKTSSKEFVLADAHGNNVGDIPHLFAENVVVKVILDVTTGMAFVQNADTNAYIEKTFVKTVNGKAPDENGNVEVAGGPGGNVDLTGYATEQFVRDGFQPKGNYLTSYTETDPTVPAWAKAASKPSYTASEVGALPSTTKIPSKTSDLTNDSGFIAGYTETDPTVPAWAKATTKPSYSKSEVGLGNVENVKQYSASNPPPYPVTSVNGKTGAVTLDASAVGARPSTWMPSASEVGALPASTTIPSKTSQLTNDSGFIKSYTETDPTVPSWAKAASKPSYSKSEVGLGNVDNVKQYSASNPPPYPVTSVNGMTGAVNLSIPTVPTKVSAFTNDAGYITQADVPVRGVDYWTTADQEAIVQQVMVAMDVPIMGRIEDDNHITLVGNLPYGTYYFSYQNVDGEETDIGSMELKSDEPVGPTYTNQLITAGVTPGLRIRSTGETEAVSGTNPTFVTGDIPVADGQTVRLKNCYIDVDGIGGASASATTAYYGNACGSLVVVLLNGSNVLNSIPWTGFTSGSGKSNYISNPVQDSEGHVTQFTINRATTTHIRLTLGGDPSSAILTIDEEITD